METFTEEHFSACYLRYRPVVRRYMALRLPDASFADDLTQDVFEHLWRSRGVIRLEGDGSVWGLVRSVARNILTDHLRRHGRRSGVMSAWTEAVEGTGAAGAAAERCLAGELRLWHRRVVEGLPTRRRRIYRLYFLGGMSYAAIARECSVSERTVGTQLCLASRFIRASLQDIYSYKAG